MYSVDLFSFSFWTGNGRFAAATANVRRRRIAAQRRLRHRLPHLPRHDHCELRSRREHGRTECLVLWGGPSLGRRTNLSMEPALFLRLVAVVVVVGFSASLCRRFAVCASSTGARAN